MFGAGASVRLTCTDFFDTARTGTSGNIAVNPASFKKLQVLLPGETAKSGTADGKDGTPNPQMAGIPFPITVRAVDRVLERRERHRRSPRADLDGRVRRHSRRDATLVSGQLVFQGTLYHSGAQTITAR